VRYKSDSVDVLKNSFVLKKFNFKIFLNFFIVVVLCLFLCFFFFLGWCESILYNHLKINNQVYYIIISLIFINAVMYFMIYNININSNINNSEYYFSLFNLGIILPMFFYTNSLYNFFFILEMVSILVFYKFSVSKFWFKNLNDDFCKKNFLERFVSRSYTNVLFYQYWVNFFSSVIILMSILNITYLYGSTEWVFLNFLNSIKLVSFFKNYTSLDLLLWNSLFLGFFFKVGITPLHLFKIEIYKGIPFISIFFYTTFYFFSYFIFFSNFLFVNLISLKTIWLPTIIFILMIGIFYIISLLFDTVFTKAFFAYSTICNSINFLLLLLTSV
jgi:NADH:ubiquinone oxidoreductase subunit 2 (subunit N)